MAIFTTPTGSWSYDDNQPSPMAWIQSDYQRSVDYRDACNEVADLKKRSITVVPLPTARFFLQWAEAVGAQRME